MKKLKAGFTLVELLVVIGIIALLIAILMPALSAAQRQSKSVKCLSALRQVGMAFKLYEQDHKGVWPVAEHTGGAAPLLPTGTRNWPDFIGGYISGKKDMAKAQDVELIRRNSVLWGCPEWTSSSENTGKGNVYDNAVRTGYGMQYYPPGQFAVITNSVKGQYVKASKWGIKGSERGVIADSQTHLIGAPAAPQLKANLKSQPWTPGYGGVMVDAARHAKPGMSQKDVRDQKTFNMLFADGHAATVSLVEAFNAIRNPGQNTVQNQ